MGVMAIERKVRHHWIDCDARKCPQTTRRSLLDDSTIMNEEQAKVRAIKEGWRRIGKRWLCPGHARKSTRQTDHGSRYRIGVIGDRVLYAPNWRDAEEARSILHGDPELRHPETAAMIEALVSSYRKLTTSQTRKGKMT